MFEDVFSFLFQRRKPLVPIEFIQKFLFRTRRQVTKTLFPLLQVGIDINKNIIFPNNLFDKCICFLSLFSCQFEFLSVLNFEKFCRLFNFGIGLTFIRFLNRVQFVPNLNFNMTPCLSLLKMNDFFRNGLSV